MDLQGLFLVEFAYLKYQLFLVYLKTGDLSPQLCLILLLEMDSTSQFLKLLPLILEQLLVIRLAFLLSQSGVQILHQTIILALIIVLQLSQLSPLFFLLCLQLQFEETTLPFDLSQPFLQPRDLPFLLIYDLLIRSFHFVDQFDSEHVLIEIGYHPKLEILDLMLLALNVLLQLAYLQVERINIFVMLSHHHLMLPLQHRITIIDLSIPLSQLFVQHSQLAQLLLHLLTLLPAHLQVLLQVKVVLEELFEVRHLTIQNYIIAQYHEQHDLLEDCGGVLSRCSLGLSRDFDGSGLESGLFWQMRSARSAKSSLIFIPFLADTRK